MSNPYAVIFPAWKEFDNVDLPTWVTEDGAKSFCSLLNSYVPSEYSKTGTRYHLLNRYPSGRLYFHLLKRPVGAN